MSIWDSLFRRVGSVAQNAVNTGLNKVKSGIDNGIENAVKNARHKASVKTKTVKLDSLPQNAEEMKAMAVYDQKNEYAVAAFTVAALLRYASSQADGKAMLDVLNGPENPSNLDLQWMDEKLLGGQDYVIRSYFKGATPKNDYTPSKPYTVELVEYKNSRDIENYVYLYVSSGGADNPRQV